MSDRDNIHIDRIKEELLFIKKTLTGINKDSFLQDDIIKHAITMSFIIIGECANHLSDGFKKQHAQVRWIEIIAVRNIAAHGYWQLDMEQIWQAIEDDIPWLCDFFDGL